MLLSRPLSLLEFHRVVRLQPLLTWIILILLTSSLIQKGESASSVIKTSGVSYCSQPRSILVDSFDVRYDRPNSSLHFDISAASVNRGLNLTARLQLNAYGRSALNLTLDLCSVLSGILCPLPTYNFTGSGSYSIPQADLPNIPEVAWNVPDLEAVFTVLLIDTPTNTAAGCLQVALDNTVTVGLSAVTWSTASVWILSFILSLAFFPFLLLVVPTQSSINNAPSSESSQLSPSSPITPFTPPSTGIDDQPRSSPPQSTLRSHHLSPWSTFLGLAGAWFYFLTLQLQQMALTGILHLNYPLIFRTWATNFAYSIGLIGLDSMNRSIDHLRSKTGGNGLSTDKLSLRYLSRRFSPYNMINDNTPIENTIGLSNNSPQNLFRLSTFEAIMNSTVEDPSDQALMANPNPSVLAVSAPGQFLVEQQQSATGSALSMVFQNTSILDPGLGSYSKLLGLPIENACLICVFWCLILVGIMVGVVSLVVLTNYLRWIYERKSPSGPVRKVITKEEHRKKGLDTFKMLLPISILIAYKLLMVIYPALSVLTFNQLRISVGESWFITLFSVFIWVFASLAMGYLIYINSRASLSYRHLKNDPKEEMLPLGRLPPTWMRGVMCMMREQSEWVYGMVFAVELVRYCFLGFGQASGQAQIIGEMGTAVIQLMITIMTKPYRERKMNMMSIFMNFSRLIEAGLLQVFVIGLEVEPISRTVVGCVLIVLQSIGFILVLGVGMFIMLREVYQFKKRRGGAGREGNLNVGKGKEKNQEKKEEGTNDIENDGMNETDGHRIDRNHVDDEIENGRSESSTLMDESNDPVHLPK